MTGNSRFYTILQSVLRVTVVIFCVVFLGIASHLTLKYGPQSDPIAIHLTSFAIENVRVGEALKGLMSWTAEFAVSNRKTGLKVVITYVDSYVMYKNIPISCGKLNETKVVVGPKQENSYEIQYNPVGCKRDHPLRRSLIKNNLMSESKHKELTMELDFVMDGYYKHGTWGWYVEIKPQCKDFKVKYVDELGQWRFTGNKACNVPRPAWYL